MPTHYKEGQCCYHPLQGVFLFSVASIHTTDTKADYILDGRSCCNPGSEKTGWFCRPSNENCDYSACEYGGNTLEVLADWSSITQCCWNKDASKFELHMKDLYPSYSTPLTNMNYSIILAGITLTKLDVYQSHINLLAYIWVHIPLTWPVPDFGWSDDVTFQIPLNHEWSVAKKFTVSIPVTGPTLYIDLMTKINPDYSVSGQVKLTGTGVLGNLLEYVPKDPYIIDDKAVKSRIGLLARQFC